MKFSFLCLAISSLYGAIDCCPPGGVDAPNSVCERCESTYANLNSAWPCICNPCDPSPWGASLNATLLVWQAKEEGLNFAFSNSPQFPTPIYATSPGGSSYTNQDIQGHFVNMDFDWAPACKVDLSIELPHKGWEMDFRWTYFYSSNSSSASADASVNGTGLLPVWMLSPTAFFIGNPMIFGNAHASWQLHFNTIDWEFGYHVFFTRALSCKLIAGLKGVSVDQHYHVQYADGVLFTTDGFNDRDFQPLSASAQLSNKSLGLGPRIGMSSQWRLGKGFSLVAGLTGALPLYVFDMKREDNDAFSFPGSVPATQTIQSEYKESFWVYRPNLECLAGLSWDTCYGKRKQFSFGVTTAYELQYFWEQNMLRLLTGDPTYYLAFPLRGDLALQGVNINFRLGF